MQIDLSFSDLLLLGIFAIFTTSMFKLISELSQVRFQSPPIITLEFLKFLIPSFKVSKNGMSSSFGP